MKAEGITYSTEVTLITCVVAAGRSDAVIRAIQGMGDMEKASGKNTKPRESEALSG